MAVIGRLPVPLLKGVNSWRVISNLSEYSVGNALLNSCNIFFFKHSYLHINWVSCHFNINKILNIKKQ